MTEKLNKQQRLSWLRILLMLVLVIFAIWILFRLRTGLSQKQIRNVVLISIDTCRADHLGCYGYPHNTSPNIDAVASQGVVFTHAVSPVPLTLPAHCSMLTGTIPTYHKVHNNIHYNLDDSIVTLAEILKEHGFVTAAVIGAFVMDSQFGLDQGFDSYNDNLERKVKRLLVQYNERTADQVTHLANSWLDENYRNNFFLFIHYFDPHAPYRQHKSHMLPTSSSPYDGEISYTDHYLGQVIKKLKDLNLYDDTLLIITSDHGESLKEHSEGSHGFFIYHSTLHVPLIFKVPGGPKNERFDSVVGLVDIVPTVCGLMDITPPETVHGKDLSFVFKKEDKRNIENRYLYCESFEPVRYNCNPLLGLVNDHWAYIQAPRQELYNLDKDFREDENLANKHPERVKLLQNHLHQILQDTKHSSNSDNEFAMDEESRKRLASLGYLTGVRIDEDLKFDDTKDDPKDWILVHQQMASVSRHIAAERYSEAEVISRQVLTEHPEYIYNYFLLGSITLEKNDILGAIGFLSEFLKRLDSAKQLNPDDKLVLTLSKTVSVAHNNLGNAFFQLAQYEQAIENFEKALVDDPNNVEARYNLGTSYHELNKIDQAIKHYTLVLELNPNLAEAHYNLGNALVELGKLSKAVDHYKKALKQKPRWADVFNQLARVKLLYENDKVHNPKEAVRYAEYACRFTGSKNPRMLHTLSLAYAAAARNSQAVKTAEKALSLAEAAQDQPLAAKIRQHLELYKSRQP